MNESDPKTWLIIAAGLFILLVVSTIVSGGPSWPWTWE